MSHVASTPCHSFLPAACSSGCTPAAVSFFTAIAFLVPTLAVPGTTAASPLLATTPFTFFLPFLPVEVSCGNSVCRFACRIIDDVPCRVLKILLHTEHLAESISPSRNPLLAMGVNVFHTTLVSFFLRIVSSSNAGIAPARLSDSSVMASMLSATASCCAGTPAPSQLSSTVVQTPASLPLAPRLLPSWIR